MFFILEVCPAIAKMLAILPSLSELYKQRFFENFLKKIIYNVPLWNAFSFEDESIDS
jgi:hypothetical protein